MRITLKTIDGKTYLSDYQSKDEIKADSGLSDSELERELNKVVELFKDFSSLSYVSLEINGRNRYFNPTNIVWAEVDLEDE